LTTVLGKLGAAQKGAKIVLGPAPVIFISQFLQRLNTGKASQHVQTWARRYATTGQLVPSGGTPIWPLADLKPVWTEMQQLTFAHFAPGIPHPLAASEAFAVVNDWLALLTLAQGGIALKLCPEPRCQRFFADMRHRGKCACCPEHANRQRARVHYAKLQKNPRKYRAYKKKQRELMKKRRKAGLA
jgi:hypothetical protein